MTYTTQQLQAMSNDEINSALATNLYKKEFTAKEIRNLIEIAGVPCDYCTKPNDIMPLAFERGFHIGDSYETIYKNSKNPKGKVWVATGDGCCVYKDTNPLRAIACLLLMMED